MSLVSVVLPAYVITEVSPAVADQPGLVLGERAGDLTTASQETPEPTAPGPGPPLLTPGQTAGLHALPAVQGQAGLGPVLAQPGLAPALLAGHASPGEAKLGPGDHLQGGHAGVTEAGGAGAHHPGPRAKLQGLTVVLGGDDQAGRTTAGAPHHLRICKFKFIIFLKRRYLLITSKV